MNFGLTYLIPIIDVAAYGSAKAVCRGARAALCCIHLGQLNGREITDNRLRRRYLGDENFQVRAKTHRALTFLHPPKSPDAVATPGSEFGGKKAELPRYFENTYVGCPRPSSAGQRVPNSPIPPWDVYQRRRCSRARTGIPAEGVRDATGTPLLKAVRPIWLRFLT